VPSGNRSVTVADWGGEEAWPPEDAWDEEEANAGAAKNGSDDDDDDDDDDGSFSKSDSAVRDALALAATEVKPGA